MVTGGVTGSVAGVGAVPVEIRYDGVCVPQVVVGQVG